MEHSIIVKKVDEFVFELFKSSDNSNLLFHDYKHTYDVVSAVIEIGNASNLNKEDLELLQKADTAYGNVIEASPATLDAYVFRARTQTLMDNDELMIKYYQQYVDLVLANGPEFAAKAKVKLIEAYNTMGAGYANTDKVKAVELFNKTLVIDPANGYATQSVQQLK